MRKLFYFMLMAVGLLISGNAGATERTAGTADELTAAVSAASDGDVIKLTAPIQLTCTLAITKSITLDVQTYALTFAGGTDAYAYVKLGTANKTVTITGSEGGEIKMESSRSGTTYGAIQITNGSVEIAGKVKITGVKYAVNVNHANVQNVTIGSDVTLVSNTVLADGGYPIYLQKMSGTFTNNSQYDVYVKGSTGASSLNAAALVSSGAQKFIFIAGGGISVDFYNNVYKNDPLGKFIIPDGYYFQYDPALKAYTLVVIPNPVVATITEIPGNMYGTLKDALTAAQDGYTINVIASSNESWNGSKSISKTKTIDFGESNATISLCDGKSYISASGSTEANLTIKGKGTIISNYIYNGYGGIISANNTPLNLTIGEGITLVSTSVNYAVREYNFNKSNKAGHLTINGNARVVFEDDSKLQSSGLIECAEGAGPIEFRAGKIYNTVYDEYKKYIYAGSSDTQGETYHTIALNSDPTNAFAIQGTTYYMSESDVAYALSYSTSSEPLKLLKDMEFTPLPARTSDLTLDLNGKVLTLTHPFGLEGTNSRITFTITDESTNHNGQLIGLDHNTILAYSNVDIHILAGQVINRCTEGDPSSIQTIAALDIEDADKGVNITLENTFPGIAESNLPRVDCTNGAAIFVQSNSSITVKQGLVYAAGFGLCNNGSDAAASTMTISGGKIWSANSMAIYHPGLGTLNISGGEIKGALSGVEIRAGELNMTGGKVISTYEGSESESWGNGNGATTIGAGIAIAQHVTNQPITVTISGGDIDAIIPVKLANPQNNLAASINQVNVAINDGRYKVTNGASAPFWSVTNNFAVSAGKFSHVPAYVVPEKTVVPNTDTDKDIYPWAIGEVNNTAVKPDGNTNITWQTAADWEGDVVPSAQDKVEIKANQTVVVSGSSKEVAHAYSITIPTGSTLTVESGAKLIVGGGGISNVDGATGLKIEPGAQVFVSPDANMNGLYGRVAFTPNVGKYDESEAEWHNKPNRYQLMGVPTKGVPTITKNKDDGDGFKLNQWDVETGWMAATKSDFTPFKGFFFWNDVQVTDKVSDLVTYYFKGELFGNKPQTLVFTEYEGFHLFANSYLAEVDILALIQGAENNVQKAVYVYDPVQERFSDISYATYGMPGMPTAIQPMQGFYFLNQRDENTTAPMDYVSMVWSNAFKVEQETVPNAPARQFGEQMSEVRVSLTDNVKGRNDGVYLMERDEVNTNANIRKMMNPATSVNVFVANESGNLSQMQSADLDGQELIITTNAAPTYTFSFEWVQGEEYYLNDIVTGASTCMSEGNTYTFTAQPNSTIEGRFFISRSNRGSVVTDMQPVKTHHAAEGIYTVMGQFMGKTAAWKSLPQGVYVVNGVKMVK